MSQKSIRRSSKVVVTALALVSSYMIFDTTENCLNRADTRKGIVLVQNLKASPEALTIPQTIASLHPNLKHIRWGGVVTDVTYGFVQIIATVEFERVNNSQQKTIDYVFDVDLSTQRLHGNNDRAKKLMDSLKPQH